MSDISVSFGLTLIPRRARLTFDSARLFHHAICLVPWVRNYRTRPEMPTLTAFL
jgi:hypothetical protein